MISLRLRLTLWYIALTLIGLSSLMIISYSTLALSLQNEIDRTLAERANHVIDALSITPMLPIQGVSLGTTDEFSQPGVFLQILNASGEVVARSFNLGASTVPAFLPRQMHLRAPFYDTQQIDGQSVRAYFKILSRDGEIVGAVQVGQSLIGLETTLVQLRTIYMVAAVVVLVFGTFTGWAVTHFGLKPVVHLTDLVQQIVYAEDLARRVPSHSTNDEIASLTTTFNHMMDRLQSLFEGQRQFLAEVAHELRTPLSSMLGNVDLIVRYGDDVQRRTETTNALQRTGRHVTRLLDDLLLLPQSKAGWHLQRQPLFLDDILINVYERFTDRRIQLQRCERASVSGDEDRLRQVLTNLIENAIKYSPHDGIINLQLWRENQRVWVQIRNTGAFIPNEKVDQVFEPYTRLDQHDHHRGTGLGLTIARWIIQEHRGQISFESSAEFGVTVRFWLFEHVETHPI